MSYAAVVQADAPVIYLQLDEANGTSVADTGSAKTPWTYYPGVKLKQAAVVFDSGSSVAPGSSGVCSLNISPSALSGTMYGRSLETWIYIDPATRFYNYAIAGIGGAYCGVSLGMQGGFLQLAHSHYYNLDQWVSTTPVTPGSHHVVLTIDYNGTASIYLDGHNVFTLWYSIYNVYPDAGFQLGTSAIGTVAPAGNRFDAAAFYNTVLNDGRVLAHYQAGVSPFPVHAYGSTQLYAEALLIKPNTPQFQVGAEGDGATAATAIGALDGVSQLAVTLHSGTVVTVAPRGQAQVAVEADGVTAVTVGTAVMYTASAQADGSTRVLLVYSAPVFGDPDVDNDFAADPDIPAPMNAPISVAMDLRGTLGVLPPLMELT